MSYYEKAGIANLSNREIAELKFHQAYGYFTLQRFAEAKPLFDAIRQIPSDPNTWMRITILVSYLFMKKIIKQPWSLLEKLKANPPTKRSFLTI